MDVAVRFLCAKNFHQSLWLPQTSDHDRLRVTFSTTSNFDDGSLPAVLFCVPMFGTRYIAQDFDHLAKTTGVRVICVDRPGMGGSTNVALNIRVRVWLETVPALLDRLNVKHVSLLCHSAGTMYLLNTIYSLRHLLDPQRPYAALIAPWVHNEHSQATLMNLVAKIPNSILDHWSDLNTFILNRILPATSWSGGVVSSVGSLFGTETGGADSGATPLAEKYGVEKAVAEQIEKLQMKYAGSESRRAGTEDAKLCLKKGGTGTWGACEDSEEFVRCLVQQEKDRRRSGSESEVSGKLQVKVWFAESDMMIGKEGPAYFRRCWEQEGVGDVLEFGSTELPGTNHETAIADFKKGALRAVFEEIGGLSS